VTYAIPFRLDYGKSVPENIFFLLTKKPLKFTMNFSHILETAPEKNNAFGVFFFQKEELAKVLIPCDKKSSGFFAASKFLHPGLSAKQAIWP